MIALPLAQTLRAWLRLDRLTVTLVLVVPWTLLAPALLYLRGGTAAAPAPAPASVAAVGASPAAPSATPARDPDPDLDQLLRALDEAHRNCEAARAPQRAAGAPLFRMDELETALLDNPWVADRALGEADTLLDEAAWLARLEPSSPLGERSWEDVRFLLGGVHWYLERAWEAGARSARPLRAHPGLAGALAGAPLAEPARHDRAEDTYDRAALREYRDVETFEELLGRWD